MSATCVFVSNSFTTTFLKKRKKHLKFENTHIIEQVKYVELVTPINSEVKKYQLE
jgi:hypothetical protein